MLRLDVTSLVWAFFRLEEKEDYMEVRKEDQRDPDEKVVEIEIERLRDFKNHPFKVQADSQMKELQESIKKYGILNPLIVRPRPEGFYEIISGHRRKYAVQQLKYTKVPVIIRYMIEEDAIISMVDANIQREEILPSERAFSLKMKIDAMRRQGSRSDLTSGNDCQKWSSDEIGETVGLKGRQVRNYIRLTYLIPEILDMVDQKKIQFVSAVDLSYLEEQIQKWVFEYIKDNGFIKTVQITALKNYPNISNANQMSVISIMNDALPKKNTEAKVSFSEKKLDKYFPSHYSAKDRETVIIQLLEQWSEAQKAIQ